MVGSAGISNNMCITTGHAYTILGAVNAGGTKLIQMRNPWGHEKYCGRYSDNSNYWTYSKKRAAGYVDADDGKWFIPLEDFRKAFERYSVLHYDFWRWSKVGVNGGDYKWIYTMRNPTRQDVIVSLDFDGASKYPSSQCYNGKNMGVYIKDTNGNNIGSAVHSAHTGSNAKKFSNLPSGNYQVVIYNFANDIQTSAGSVIWVYTKDQGVSLNYRCWKQRKNDSMSCSNRM